METVSCAIGSIVDNSIGKLVFDKVAVTNLVLLDQTRHVKVFLKLKKVL